MQQLKLVSSSVILKSLDNYSGCFKRSLPNILTLLRLLAVPLVIYLILHQHLFSAFIVFACASFTDWIDGFLARRWRVESAFGQVFDPIADKTLVVSSSLLLGYTGHLPLWFVVLIAFRDILLLLGGVLIFLKKLTIPLAPIFISKINTFAQLSLLGLVMIFDYRFTIAYSEIWTISWIGMGALLFITAVTTVLSGAVYLKNFVKGLS